MKLLYVILISAFLTGCSVITPVKRKFPEVPQELQQKCEELKMITGEKVSITDMMKVIVENYRLHYECENKVEGWQEWYTEQKKIFDTVK